MLIGNRARTKTAKKVIYENIASGSFLLVEKQGRRGARLIGLLTSLRYEM